MSKGTVSPDVERAIRETATHVAVHGGSVRHATGRMRDRSVSIRDVVKVLKTGSIEPDPEHTTGVGDPRYRVVGTDYDGDPLTVVVAVPQDPDAPVAIITLLG